MAIDDETRDVIKWNADPENNSIDFREENILQLQQQYKLVKTRDEAIKANIPRDSMALKLNLGLMERLRAHTGYPDINLIRNISNGMDIFEEVPPTGGLKKRKRHIHRQVLMNYRLNYGAIITR